MTNEKSPLLPIGGEESSEKSPAVYFLDRNQDCMSVHSKSHSVKSKQSKGLSSHDATEIEKIPKGSIEDAFKPRPVSVAGSVNQSAMATASKGGGWFNNFFANVNKKSKGLESVSADPNAAIIKAPSVPVKIDPKVFFANERTFLAWLHVAVLLAGASVAIAALSDSNVSGPDQLYGVILLPVAISFIVYAMIQYTRRASMIRRKSPGPYVDVAGPTALTVILMFSIVAQFSIKLYTLM